MHYCRGQHDLAIWFTFSYCNVPEYFAQTCISSCQLNVLNRHILTSTTRFVPFAPPPATLSQLQQKRRSQHDSFTFEQVFDLVTWTTGNFNKLKRNTSPEKASRCFCVSVCSPVSQLEAKLPGGRWLLVRQRLRQRRRDWPRKPQRRNLIGSNVPLFVTWLLASSYGFLSLEVYNKKQ